MRRIAVFSYQSADDPEARLDILLALGRRAVSPTGCAGPKRGV
jgi:hypothetical protein